MPSPQKLPVELLRGVFVTGMDTNVGKTIVSGLLVRALGADYWKPIQCGEMENPDREVVRNLSVSGKEIVCHPERYFLKAPKSPHQAAKEEGKQVRVQDFSFPYTQNSVIVEGAGGVLVPLNSQEYVIDLAIKFELPVVVVLKNYLGGINHSLLTFEALVRRGLKILGLVFNGENNPESEELILQKTGIPCLTRLAWCSRFSEEYIQEQVKNIQKGLRIHE